MLDCEDKAFVLIGHTQAYKSVFNTFDYLLLTVPTPAAWLILSLLL